LGNATFAQKGIFECGWGPLTYALLEVPQFKSNYSTISNPVLYLEAVNIEGKVVQSKLDSLVEERQKSESCNRKYEKLMADGEEHYLISNRLTI
jgi:hypothetical protein